MKQGFGNEFKDKLTLWNKLKDGIPSLVGNEAKNNFQDNFNKQSFDGKQWKEVKRRIQGTPEYKYPKKKGTGRRTKAILVGTGKLRKDIQVKKKSFSETIIGTSQITPYAQAHNEGTSKIPKRQFIGGTKKLENDMLNIIKKELDKLFK